MYGGDEINAVVVDVGTSTTKGGYSGEDSPKCVFPTVVGVTFSNGDENTVGEGTKAVGETTDMDIDANNSKTPSSKVLYHVGTNSLQFRREHMEIKYPMEKGLVTDWDGMEQIWHHTFQERLRIDPSTTPILLAEASFNTKPLREKMTELMFEKFQVPALFVSKSAVLTSFASGKASSLVLDSGGGTTSAVPVHDGYVLTKNIVKSSLGGEFLTNEYANLLLNQRKIEIRPHYLIKTRKEIGLGEFEVHLRDSANATESYRQYQVMEIIRDMKECVSRVSDAPFVEEVSSSIPGIPYELPDGTTIDLGTDRFSIPELLFNPSPLNERENKEEEFIGIQKMIFNAIGQTDPDIRRELFQSILLSGGNTLLPQFPERLHKEMTERSTPQNYRVRILSSTIPAERKFSVWLGGSILSSLGTFHQLWMSKQEYEEHGRAIVERKCP